MEDYQQKICLALGNVRYLPGSFDKRFALNMSSIARLQPEKVLSKSQNEWMFRILYKYRKQLPALYQLHKDNPLCTQKSKNQKYTS
jgi:hypothetical protein